MNWIIRQALFASLVVGLLGAFAVIPPTTETTGGERVQIGGGPAGDTGGVLPEDGVEIAPEEIVAGPADPRAPARDTGGLQCAPGRNGGATDVGVTGDRIRLAATVVQSGPGETFLGSSPIGMQAVVRKVNQAGGICGRILDLTLRDDGWDATRGRSFLRAFIDEGYFALPVVPSSEGLTAAIESGDIERAGIPVIGTDGMLIQQYEDPWVWPVATATVSTMRIMARFGHQEGARTFGVVYDQRYRFGREGAEAFREYVQTLSGAQMGPFIGVEPGRSSYSSEARRFNSGCDSVGGCDFVAMLLEPQTALTWINQRPQMGRQFTSGAQPLFNEQFAAGCAERCTGMLVWTGYNPPIGHHASRPGVAEYMNDVRRISPTVDVNNQFLQGAYLGMQAFVRAVEQVGPNLTRAALRDVMNSTTLTTDLASPLQWTATRRFANRSAQAFEIVVSQGSFAGFAERTGFIEDPRI